MQSIAHRLVDFLGSVQVSLAWRLSMFSRRQLRSGAVLTSFVLLFFSPPPALASPKVGRAAPDFSLRDLEGTLFRLSDLAYKGKESASKPKQVVVLDFFRTDCKPCIKGLPKLKELHWTYKGKGVKMLLIALLEEKNGEEKLFAFLKANPLPFTVLVDSYGTVAKKYVLKAGKVKIPALFLLDRKRMVKHVVRGLNEKAIKKLNSKIEKLAR